VEIGDFENKKTMKKEKDVIYRKRKTVKHTPENRNPKYTTSRT
jgi:hypothetical protein